MVRPGYKFNLLGLVGSVISGDVRIQTDEIDGRLARGLGQKLGSDGVPSDRRVGERIFGHSPAQLIIGPHHRSKDRPSRLTWAYCPRVCHMDVS